MSPRLYVNFCKKSRYYRNAAGIDLDGWAVPSMSYEEDTEGCPFG